MDTRSEVIAVTSDVGDAELVGVPKPSLFRRIIRSGGFFLSTQANLVNAGIIHMIILFVLFVHFFYTSYVEAISPDSEDPGPDDGTDPNYVQKAIVPQVEFALMFLLLWGLIMLPLSMMRYTANRLAQTWVARWLPVDRLVDFHVFIGYHMLFQIGAVVILFMGHIGHLCVAYRAGIEPENFCNGKNSCVDGVCDDGVAFNSEIMATGYAIFAIAAIIAIPAIFRSRVSYEVFYALHHFFIAFYAIVIAHTLDPRGRSDFSSRFQTVFWVCGPMFLYSLDRSARNASICKMPIVSVRLMYNPRAVVLRVRPPSGWHHLVGQYIKIRVGAVSSWEWHPYSIASSPRSTDLELILRVIEPARPAAPKSIAPGPATIVVGPDGSSISRARDNRTWSGRVFDHFESLRVRVHNRDTSADISTSHIDVEGPYGSVMQGAFSLPSVLLLASGTGIVPMLSVLRELYAADKFSIRARPNVTAAPASPLVASQVDAVHTGVGLGRELRPPTLTTSSAASTGGKIEAQFQRGGDVRVLAARSRAKRAWQALRAKFRSGEGRAFVLSLLVQATHPRRFINASTYRLPISMDASVARERSFPLAAVPPRSGSSSRYNAATIGPDLTDSTLELLRRYLSSRRTLATFWLAATRSLLFCSLSLLIGAWQFLATCLELSFYTGGLGTGFSERIQWPYYALDGITVASLLGFLFVVIVQPWVMKESYSAEVSTTAIIGREIVDRCRRFARHLSLRQHGGDGTALWNAPTNSASSATVQSRGATLLNLIALVAQAVLVSLNFGTPRPSTLIVTLLCLTRLYQMFFHYSTNPLFLLRTGEDASAQREKAAFMTSAHLLWVSRTPEMFLATFHELRDIVGATRSGPLRVRVECFITAADESEKARVRDVISGTVLEGCVQFSRPSVDSSFSAVCDSLLHESDQQGDSPHHAPPSTAAAMVPLRASSTVPMPVVTPALNVFVCGSTALAADARKAFMAARERVRGRMVLAFGSETVFG